MTGTFGLESLRWFGAGLSRPECVLAHRSGLLLAPDWTEPGGVSLIRPDGAVTRLLVRAAGPGVETPIRPNGIALEPGGAVLIAHLGAERGAVYRLTPDGVCALVCDRVEGAPMPPANFVARDRAGRLWITVSTRIVPRARDYRPDASTGFIAVLEPGETDARVVADGLGYANECLLSADETMLWVNETFARKTTAFTLAGGRLSARRQVAAFGAGEYPDGLAEDVAGGLLVTSIVSNRVLRIAPTGGVEVLIEDADAAHVAAVEAAFLAGRMDRPHLDRNPAPHLANVSNLAFGGPDRRTAYLGCLLGDRIAAVDWPIAGRELPHWNFDLGALTALAGTTNAGEPV